MKKGCVYRELSSAGDPLTPIGVDEVLKSLLDVSDDSLSSSCTRALYRRSWLSNLAIIFPPDITMAEDYCFLLSCLEARPRIGRVGLLLYRVNRNSGSVTAGVIPNIDESMNYMNERLINLGNSFFGIENLVSSNLVNNAWIRLDNASKLSFSESIRASTNIFSSDLNRLAIHQAQAFDYKNNIRQIIFKLGFIHPILPAVILRWKRWFEGFR